MACFPTRAGSAGFEERSLLLDVLQGEEPEEVLRLLEALEKKFNGDVFDLTADTKLTKKSLRSFARLVEARTVGEQRYLWELYSFDHLPVDVISHLYQRFVQGSTAVYTPPFLAALLLDVAMPYEKLTGSDASSIRRVVRESSW